MKKALLTYSPKGSILNSSLLKTVGARGFEPPTPWSQTRCASQAAPRPEQHLSVAAGCRMSKPQWARNVDYSKPGKVVADGDVERFLIDFERAGVEFAEIADLAE